MEKPISDVRPTRAYDLLETDERDAVDNYVEYVINNQRFKRERIALALNYPIPTEYIKKSKNALYKPIVRAAISERIGEEAEKQDISPDRLIKEYATVGLSRITDFLETRGLGDFALKDLRNVEPALLGAIKSIETKPGAFGLHTKITLHDKMSALNALAVLMGLITPEKTPVLKEYVKPLEAVQQDAALAGDTGYVKLLERMKNHEQ